MNLLRLFFLFSILLFLPAISASQTQHERAAGIASHQIQSLLDSISATNIHAYLDTLVGFYTRHTMSDTTSDLVGIGAARRWVFRKFQEFSQASGGQLQPMYFDFDATICGVTKHHRNVMAVLPGTLTPDRYFIVSGHLDNRGDPINACSYQNLFSPGANDDGSGTAISIELARVMSQYQFDASIIFMAVTGEDEGLFGSDAHARYARQINMRIDGMITNDVVGNIVGSNGIVDSMSVRHFSSVSETTPHRQFARYMKLKGESFYPIFTVNLIPAQDRPGRGGDHQSYQAQGYTAVRFTEPNENTNNQHSATDVVDSMSPAYSARVARLNAAGLASVAWAPETPSGLQVLDPGNGTELILQWDSVNTEPDFAGYRIAVRDSGELYYLSVIDAGNGQQDTISGLTPGVAVYVSISAYDTAGNESIFSQEVFAKPAIAPSSPTGFTSTSLINAIQLTWNASPQLDVAKYRIYRSTTRVGGFGMYDSVTAPMTQYNDFGAAPHVFYYYHVRAVDSSGYESLPTQTAPGQLATHDAGILVVDGTRDGPGGPPGPTDGAVDSFYIALLARAAGTISHYDIADSVAANISISDADMAIYSTLVWHSDFRNSTPIYRDTTAIREYLNQGGNLILDGWKLSASLKSLGGTGVTIFPPNSFVPNYLKVDSMQTTGTTQRDFYIANSVMPGYPSIKVDSVKIPQFNGTLVNTDVFLPPFIRPLTEIVYTHHAKDSGSVFEGKTIALRYLGTDYKLVFFDFPLYFMEFLTAQQAMERALLDLEEVVAVDEKSNSTVPGNYTLYQNHPNPFNPMTIITYEIAAVSHVALKIYNLLGQEVTTLVNEQKGPGTYSITWDARNFSSGVYFYRLTAGEFSSTKKLVLMR